MPGNHEYNSPPTSAGQAPGYVVILKFALPVALALCSASVGRAADTACEVTLPGGVIDTRTFPTTPGDTVLNGRNDGNPATCNIISLGTVKVIDYPDGLQINSAGTGLKFQLVQVDIKNGLTVDDGGDGSGLVTFSGDQLTRIAGPVTISNQAKLKFITHNSRSPTSRLRLENAYFDIAAGSELQAEFKLGDTTGGEFIVGAIQGDGDLRLSNAGSASRQGTIYIQNGDNRDYSYTGDIHYSNQSLPSIAKRGDGTFTFTGDVKNSAGDTPGFTDGFGTISVDGGAFETTTEAFVYGTSVSLSGGDLILNQAADGEIDNASFSGDGTLYKRGAAKIDLGGISGAFKGDVVVESGTLGLTRGASLPAARLITIASGAVLDVSGVYNSTRLSRLAGAGTIALGSKDVGGMIRVSPGDSIGVLSVTGTGQFDIAGALVDIEIDPTRAPGDVAGTTHDQLDIAGPVAIGGVNPLIEIYDVQQAASPTAFLNGREFTLLRAGSGLARLTASNVTENLSSFHAFIGADPEKTTITDTEVKVQFGIKTVQQVSTAVSTAPTGSGGNGSTKNKNNATQQYLQKVTGLTGNQAPTQAQLTTNPALQNLTTTNLARATSNNNPEAYSSNLTLGLEYADKVANMVMNHANGSGIAYQMANDLEPHEGRVWFDAAYLDGQVDGESDETGDFDYILSSLVVGGDLVRKANYNLGLFAGTGRSDMDEHDHIDQDLEGRFYHIGAYHHYQMSNDYFLNSMVTFFEGDFDSKRQNYDTNGGFAAESESDFKMQGGTVGVKLARHFQTSETMLITPTVGLSYTRIEQDSIRESGGGEAYDYRIEEADAEAVVLGIGLDFVKSLASSSRPVFLDMMLRYEYDAYANDNDTHDIEAGLAGQESSSFVGQNRGEHGLLVGIGLESETSKNLTLGAGIVYSERSNGSEAQINGNLTYYW